VAEVKAFELDVGYESESELENGRQIIDVEPSATIFTTKIQPSEPDDPEEGKRLFHSQMCVKGTLLHFIIDSGSQNNLISTEVFKQLVLLTMPHSQPYTIGWLCQGSYNVPTLGHHYISGCYDDQNSQMDVIESTVTIEGYFGVHLASLILFHHYDPFHIDWLWVRCILTVSMILSILSYKLIKFTEEVIWGTIPGGTSQCNSSLESRGTTLQDSMMRSDF
jgi:hypothetical protein